MSTLLAPQLLRTIMKAFALAFAAIFDGISGYMSNTFGEASDGALWTLSIWVKMDRLSGAGYSTLFTSNAVSDTQIYVHLEKLYVTVGGGLLVPTQLFRNLNVFENIVIRYDSRNPTPSERLVVYIGGERVTAFDTEIYPAQHAIPGWNTPGIQRMGIVWSGTGQWLVSTVAAVRFIDGQGLDATLFGKMHDTLPIWVFEETPLPAGITKFPADVGMLSHVGLVAYTPAAIIDGNIASNGFHTDTTAPGDYLQFDCGVDNAREFTRVVITTSALATYAVWDVIYSDDATNWQTAATGLDVSVSLHNSLSWDTVGIHRYWRLLKTSAPQGGNYHTGVTFFDMDITGYGSNGFKLDFADVGLGLELSAFDTAIGAGMTYSDADLTATTTSPRQHLAALDDLPSEGITRWEITLDAARLAYTTLGIQTSTVEIASTPDYLKPYDVWGFADQAQTAENGVIVQSYAHPADRVHWIMEFDADRGTLSYFAGDQYVTQIVGLFGTYKPYFGIETPVIISVVFDKADHEYGGTIQLGYDTSGKGNDWDLGKYGTIISGTSVPNDTIPTFNPLNGHSSIVYSDGNATITSSGATIYSADTTLLIPTTGKFEVQFQITAMASGYPAFGMHPPLPAASRTGDFLGDNADYYGARSQGGTAYTVEYNISSYIPVNNPWYSVNDVMRYCYDADTLELWIGVWDGASTTWLSNAAGDAGDPDAGTNPTLTNVPNGLSFCASLYDGATGTYSPECSFVECAVSFNPLIVNNLPKAPSILSDHWKTVTWTGDGTSPKKIVTDFDTHFGWIKKRGVAEGHQLFDALRNDGTDPLLLASDTTATETAVNRYLVGMSSTPFATDGVNVSSTGNASGVTYVGWFAHLPGVAIPVGGDLTISGIRYNEVLGMAAINYTGNGVAGATLAIPNFGKKPGMIKVKRLDGLGTWRVYHKDLGATKFLQLDTNAAAIASITSWNDTEPTDQLITLGSATDMNAAGGTYVAYVYWETEHISIGTYTSNADYVNPPFINTGSNVEYLMIKSDYAGADWAVKDLTRGIDDLNIGVIYPNFNYAEDAAVVWGTGHYNNGFMPRNTTGNASLNYTAGIKHYYMAFGQKIAPR